MDKYEYKVSIGEINKLIEAGEYAQAAEIADMIDWSKVRSIRTLCRISDLYKVNKRFEDSRDILRMAKERSPENRQILFSMCELELKLNNYMLALSNYNKYVELYPNDSERYILQYKIIKAHGGGYQDQIAVLEELTSRDYRERWAYELARVYYLAEEDYLCIQECEGIYAFYGYGDYVRKALELKAKLVDLTPEEQERLDYLKNGGKEPDPFYEDLSGSQGQGLQAPAGAGREEPLRAEKPGREEKQDKGEKQGEEEKPSWDSVSDKTQVRPPSDVSFGELLGNQVTLGDLMEGRSRPEEEEKEEGNRFQISAPEPKEADHGINVPPLDQGIFSEEYMQKTIAQGLRELDLTEDKTGQYTMNLEPGQEDPVPEGKKEAAPSGEGKDAGSSAGEEDEDVRTDRPRKTARYSDMFATPEEREALKKAESRASSTARLDRDEIMGEWKRIQRENESGSSQVVRDRIQENAGPAVRHPYSAGERRRGRTSEKDTSTRPWNADEVREAMRRSRSGGALPGSFVVANERDTAPIDLSEYTSSIPAGGDTTRLPGGRVFMPSVGSESGDSGRSQEEIALEGMNMDSYTGNMIITGDEGSGTLRKAREMISRFREIDHTFVGKIAKTTGRQATPGALRKAVPNLEYGAMIIEHASGMSSDGIAALIELLTGEEHKIIVFLIDKKTYMDALLHDYRKLRRAFTARIDIAALSMDVLLHYAEEYALSQEHSIDDSGMDALSYRLEHMQEDGHSVTLEEVRALVDEAVYFSGLKSPGNFIRRLTRKRYDSNNMVILRDADFLHD